MVSVLILNGALIFFLTSYPKDIKNMIHILWLINKNHICSIRARLQIDASLVSQSQSDLKVMWFLKVSAHAKLILDQFQVCRTLFIRFDLQIDASLLMSQSQSELKAPIWKSLLGFYSHSNLVTPI